MDSSIDKQFTTTPQQQHELGEKELDRLSIISSVEWRQMRLEDKRLYNLDPRPAMQVTNVTSILQPGATPAAEQLIRAWDLHNLRWELVKPSRQGFWTVRQADQDQAKAQGLAMCEVVRFRSLTVSLGSACHVDFQYVSPSKALPPGFHFTLFFFFHTFSHLGFFSSSFSFSSVSLPVCSH